MIHLYNTLTRKVEELKPIRGGRVGLYTCGPTVYNFAHIGNLRTYIFEDILKRTLIYNGLKVKHVMNITDVGHLTSDADVGEDKMEKGAKREGKTAWEIAKFYTKAFKHDLADLNIVEPNTWCRATDHIKEQIALVRKLEKKGFTYQTTDGVYFDTSKLPDYGKLANLKNQELKAGARVEMGDKKNPHDFALWKFFPRPSAGGEKRQMEWGSPWGVGFPGWHIECSAMAVKYLGQPFDIHCGGIDHVSVHHTNEIAQSEAAAGKPLANVWMHGEFLLIGADKMAKSGENFITLQTIKDRGIDPLAYRYFLLQTHYRKQLTFSWEALKAAQQGLEHLYNAARSLSLTVILSAMPTGRQEAPARHDLPSGMSGRKNLSHVKQQFSIATSSDLDIPTALAVVWKALKDKTIDLKTLIKFDEVLGLEIKKHLKIKIEKKSSAVEKIIKTRDAARAVKNWGESDRLRQELEGLGYTVEDTKDGTRVTKK